MTLKPDAARRILDQCIESGITRGYNKAHKHIESPTQEMIEDCQNVAIWNEIYEWFDFPEVAE